MNIMKEGSLGGILHKSQIISEDDIKAALDEQGRTGARFGEALVSLGIVTQEDIDWALSHQLDIPYVRIKKEMVDAEAVALVPAAVARKYELLPLVKAGDELSIAIADPLNKEAIAAVERVSGCRVILSMGLIREIREMQDECYGLPALDEDSLGFTSSSFSPAALMAINTDPTGGKLLEYLLVFCSRSAFSSFLFFPVPDGIIITGRKNGKHRQVGRLAPAKYADFLSLLKKTAGIGVEDATGTIAVTRASESMTFGVNVLATDSGDVVTLTNRPASAQASSLADLIGDDGLIARFQEIVAAPKGIVLVAADVEETRSKIISLVLRDITGGRIPLVVGNVSAPYPHVAVDGDPAIAVRRALGQDVDVLVIADLDDPRAVRAARSAALKGKLVVGGVTHGDIPDVIRELLYYRDRGWLVPSDVAGIVAVAEVSGPGGGSGAIQCGCVAQAVPAATLTEKLTRAATVEQVVEALGADGIVTLTVATRSWMDGRDSASAGIRILAETDGDV